MPCTAFTLKGWGRDPRTRTGDPVPSSANLHTEGIGGGGGQDGKRRKAAHDYRKLHLPLGVGFLHIVLKRSVTRCKRR